MACHMRPCEAEFHRQGGFSYMWTLMLIFLMSLGLSVAVEIDSTNSRREKEKELISIGRQFREAIGRYYEASRTVDRKVYPASFDDLLEDKRFPGTNRHLRKIFIDPVTGSSDWGVLRIDGKIVGIYSVSEMQPIKMDGFDLSEAEFKNSQKYSDWVFSYPPNLILVKPDAVAKNSSSSNKNFKPTPVKP